MYMAEAYHLTQPETRPCPELALPVWPESREIFRPRLAARVLGMNTIDHDKTSTLLLAPLPPPATLHLH